MEADFETKSLMRRLLPRPVRRLGRRCLNLPAQARFTAARSLNLGANHRRIAALRRRHAGRRGFIIGSGPSVRQMDITPLRDEITFGFNAFYHIADEIGFLPTYYLVEDALPAEDNAPQLNQLEGTTKVFAHDLRYCLTPDDHTIFVYFDRYYASHPSPRFPQFSSDASRKVYWGGTVAYMAIQLAYYIGLSEIYLIGIDLTYKTPETMASDVIISGGDDENHFHAAYFGKGKRWHDPKVDRMQASFEYAEQWLGRRDVRLYNATVGGNLQRVPRVTFADLFQSPSP